MPFRRRGDVLVAVVHHPDRALGLEGEEARMEGQDRGVLLLATEPAAGLGLDDADLVLGQREPGRHRGVDVVRALEAAVDGHAALRLGHGDHHHRLDVQLLLVARPVRPLEDEVGGPQRGHRVAAGQLVAGELLAALLRIEDGLEWFRTRVERRQRDGQGRPVGRRHQREGLSVVADLAADGDEDRLVVMDEADDVRAGDVVGGRDDDPVPRERLLEVEGDEPGMRLGRADRAAVPGPGEDEIVGVQRLAGQLAGSLAAEWRRACAPDRGPAGDHRDRRRVGLGGRAASSGWAGGCGRRGRGGLLRSRLCRPVLGRVKPSCGQSRPCRRPRPGVAPVCWPSRTTGTPATRTWSMPIGNWRGSS